MSDGNGLGCPVPGGGSCPTVERLDGDVQGLRQCVTSQLAEMMGLYRQYGTQIESMMSLVRQLEPLLVKFVEQRGVQDRDRDMVKRIGREVQDHEKRVRELEKLSGTVASLATQVATLVETYPNVAVTNAVNANRISNTERVIWVGLTVALAIAGIYFKT